ncbi:hypothetical protein AB6735_18630 [Mucilaginibacter sp. RCC_168]|uniref:hypothetical protein n=1 Tax=Mucilaginibacter sp. RCC_168 TaxID=3239221 RepID=UPI003523C8CE
MKLEQAKELFFAQYLGQKVCEYSDLIKMSRICVINHFNSHKFTDAVLLLRSVSQLTDEEAVNLAYLAMYHPSIEDYSISEVWIGEGDIRPNGGTWLEIGCRCWVGELGIEPDGHMFLVDEDSEKEDAIYDPVKCIDYLRSIGILLPFTYLNEQNKPITLQPDEIIDLNWASIKSQNN